LLSYGGKGGSPFCDFVNKSNNNIVHNTEKVFKGINFFIPHYQQLTKNGAPEDLFSLFLPFFSSLQAFIFLIFNLLRAILAAHAIQYHSDYQMIDNFFIINIY